MVCGVKYSLHLTIILKPINNEPLNLADQPVGLRGAFNRMH